MIGSSVREVPELLEVLYNGRRAEIMKSDDFRQAHQVVDVVRVIERMMSLNLIIEEDLLNVISGYRPQVG